MYITLNAMKHRGQRSGQLSVLSKLSSLYPDWQRRGTLFLLLLSFVFLNHHALLIRKESESPLCWRKVGNRSTISANIEKQCCVCCCCFFVLFFVLVSGLFHTWRYLVKRSRDLKTRDGSHQMSDTNTWSKWRWMNEWDRIKYKKMP